jgi:Xaa-Pro aminopeptidase
VASDLLIHASTLGSATMRHEVPARVLDPFLYGEHDGGAFAVLPVIDAPNVPDGIEVLDPFALGLLDLIASGLDRESALAEVCVRAVRSVGLTAAVVPREFPLFVAESLRAAGVALTVDGAFFDDRRRVKNAAELAGVRRASEAAVAGMGAAATMLARCEVHQGSLIIEGREVLTSERVAAEIRGVVASLGCRLDDLIVAGGAQGAVGHDQGSGPLRAGSPVVVDLWPEDRVSGCWSDMTRTFVVGEPSDEVIRWHSLARDALARSVAVIAPGVLGRDVWEVACDVFEAAGEPTQRSSAGWPSPLRDGFFYSLGHGVGLETHEAPGLGPSGREPLVAGDVLAVEPGTGRHGVGAARVEDLYLVLEDGVELLTPFPHELDPRVGAGA